MPEDFYAVVMAGGSGTRFWPLSRQHRPKHLLKLIEGKTLLRLTLERLSPLFSPQDILVITQADQVTQVQDDVGDLIRQENLIAEPIGKDTAACIGLAAVLLEKRVGQCIFCALPADHYIEPKQDFHNSLRVAYNMASDGWLTTFGIYPTYPATAYGYLLIGDLICKKEDINVYRLRRFCEKPTQRSAERFIETRQYYWNSGMFVWSTQSILGAIQRYMPNLYNGLKKISSTLGSSSEQSVLRENYERFVRISIDFGVMEKADRIAMVEAKFQWSDLGSFLTIAGHKYRDSSGNVTDGEFYGVESSNCIILSEQGHLIATFGLKDILIVHTQDATLICPKEKASQLKPFVEGLSKRGLERFL
jgi:mannose-1-phosphate guanylyltransferase